MCEQCAATEKQLTVKRVGESVHILAGGELCMLLDRVAALAFGQRIYFTAAFGVDTLDAEVAELLNPPAAEGGA